MVEASYYIAEFLPEPNASTGVMELVFGKPSLPSIDWHDDHTLGVGDLRALEEVGVCGASLKTRQASPIASKVPAVQANDSNIQCSRLQESSFADSYPPLPHNEKAGTVGTG